MSAILKDPPKFPMDQPLTALHFWPCLLWVISGVAWFTCCMVGVRGMSSLGGPGSAWFHFLHPFLLAPLILWTPVWFRLLFQVSLGAAMLGIFFGINPPHLAEPLAPAAIGFFVFLTLLSILLGVHIDRSRLEIFLLHTTLREERANLTQIVAEQTAELRSFARHLDQVQENERAYLARELHDESGQTLTALRYVLRAGLRKFHQDPPSARPLLEQLPTLLDRLADQHRAVLVRLRPGPFDNLDLESSITQLLQETQQKTGILCELSSTPLPDGLPPPGRPVMAAPRRPVMAAPRRPATAGTAERRGTVAPRVKGEARGRAGREVPDRAAEAGLLWWMRPLQHAEPYRSWDPKERM
jgi:hypothetical protein